MSTKNETAKNETAKNETAPVVPENLEPLVKAVTIGTMTIDKIAAVDPEAAKIIAAAVKFRQENPTLADLVNEVAATSQQYPFGASPYVAKSGKEMYSIDRLGLGEDCQKYPNTATPRVLVDAILSEIPADVECGRVVQALRKAALEWSDESKIRHAKTSEDGKQRATRKAYVPLGF